MKNKKKIYDIIGISILPATVLAYLVAGTSKLFGPSQGIDLYDWFIILPLLIAEVEVYVGIRYLRFESNLDYSKAYRFRKNIIGGMVIIGSVLIGVLNRYDLFLSSNGVWLFIDRMWFCVVGCVLIWFAFRHLGSAIGMCFNQSGQNVTGKTKVIAVVGAVLLLAVAVLFARIPAFWILGMLLS